jgi:hypothetical protein
MFVPFLRKFRPRLSWHRGGGAGGETPIVAAPRAYWCLLTRSRKCQENSGHRGARQADWPVGFGSPKLPTRWRRRPGSRCSAWLAGTSLKHPFTSMNAFPHQQLGSRKAVDHTVRREHAAFKWRGGSR